MTQRLRREVRLPVYWLIVGLAVAVASPVASVFAAVEISETKAANQDRRAAAVQAETQAQTRVVVCRWFAAALDLYVESPPATEIQRNAQVAYLELYKLTQCQPARDK